jgi:hypothetical protein
MWKAATMKRQMQSRKKFVPGNEGQNINKKLQNVMISSLNLNWRCSGQEKLAQTNRACITTSGVLSFSDLRQRI